MKKFKEYLYHCLRGWTSGGIIAQVIFADSFYIGYKWSVVLAGWLFVAYHKELTE